MCKVSLWCLLYHRNNSACPSPHPDLMRPPELLDRCDPGVGDRADPFGGVHVALHDDVADRLVDVAQGEDEQERRVERVVGGVDARQYHEEHERDLQNRAECGVSGGAVRVVLRPVPHADQRGDAVNQQHPGADAVRLVVQAHRVQQRIVDRDQREAGAADQTAAQVDEALGPLERELVVPGADLLADEDRGGVREAAEECDHDALERAEHGDRCDRLFILMAEHDIDHHVADADQEFVAQDREAFLQVLVDHCAVPAEMAGKFERVRQFVLQNKEQQHEQVHDTGKHRPERRAGSAHARQPELAEDQQIVEKAVRENRRNPAVQGNSDLLDGAQQRAECHREDLQRVCEADDPQV